MANQDSTALCQPHAETMDAARAQIIIKDVFAAGPVPEAELILSSCGFAVLSGNLLRYLYVEPDERRQGKGAALVAEAVRRASGPVKTQCLARLVPYYERMGFKTVLTAEGGTYHYMVRASTDEEREAVKESTDKLAGRS